MAFSDLLVGMCKAYTSSSVGQGCPFSMTSPKVERCTLSISWQIDVLFAPGTKDPVCNVQAPLCLADLIPPGHMVRLDRFRCPGTWWGTRVIPPFPSPRL